MENHGERAHARFSISSFHRTLNCTGSVALIETLPKQITPTVASLKGTRQHEVNQKAVAQFLTYKTDGIPSFLWREEVEDEPEIEFFADKAVATAETYSRLIWTKVLEEAMTGKAWGVEEKVIFDKQLDIWGTCDFWTIYINDKGKRTLSIVDYKNGHHVVEVPKNEQLIGYVVAFRKELQRQGKDIDLAITAIIQPNANCDPYREYKYTPKQLDAWENKIYNKISDIVKGKIKFKVGDWCTFCPAMAICKTYEASMRAKTELSLLDTKEIKFPNIETWSDEQLGRAALVSDDIIEFARSIKALVINKVKAGSKIPGVKVIESEGRRAWIKDLELVGEMLKQNGFKEPFRKQLITLTEARKKIKDNILDPFVTRTQPSLCVVPESDDRPAIGSIKDMLTDLK